MGDEKLRMETMAALMTHKDARIFKLAETNEQLRIKISEMQLVIKGLGVAWPPKDVTIKLVEAAKILLSKHDYDGHGYEEIHKAIEVAESDGVDQELFEKFTKPEKESA